jgi:hypothetical protein
MNRICFFVLCLPIIAGAASAGVFEDGVFSERLVIGEAEELKISNPHELTLAGGIVMTNATLTIDSQQDSSPEADNDNIVSFSEDSSAEVLFAQNALLQCVTNLTAEMAGVSFGGSTAAAATLCGFSMGVNIATCQFQVKPSGSSTIRSVNLTFTQKEMIFISRQVKDIIRQMHRYPLEIL